MTSSVAVAVTSLLREHCRDLFSGLTGHGDVLVRELTRIKRLRQWLCSFRSGEITHELALEVFGFGCGLVNT